MNERKTLVFFGILDVGCHHKVNNTTGKRFSDDDDDDASFNSRYFVSCGGALSTGCDYVPHSSFGCVPPLDISPLASGGRPHPRLKPSSEGLGLSPGVWGAPKRGMPTGSEAFLELPVALGFGQKKIEKFLGFFFKFKIIRKETIRKTKRTTWMGIQKIIRKRIWFGFIVWWHIKLHGLFNAKDSLVEER